MRRRGGEVQGTTTPIDDLNGFGYSSEELAAGAYTRSITLS